MDTIELLEPPADEFTRLMASIEESRSAFRREYFDAMADQVDRELMAANKSAFPITCAVSDVWTTPFWDELVSSMRRNSRRRKRHARYRRGREKVRPRHRRQRRS